MESEKPAAGVRPEGRTAAEIIAGKRVLLFDLFQTLTNTDPWEHSRPHTSELLGLDNELWKEMVFHRSRDRLIGRLTDPVEIMMMMAHGIDAAVPLEKIRAAAENRIERFKETLSNISPRVIRTLEELRRRGYRLGLVSNADFTETIGWPGSPLEDLFDTVVFSCEAGYAKPEPEIYRIALERLGAEADEAVFIGDGSSGELEGARRAGLDTVMAAGVIRRIWPWEIDVRAAHADAIVEVIDQLL
ncbi:MAG: HAD family hydrolase [Spirochaetia bacterium]